MVCLQFSLDKARKNATKSPQRVIAMKLQESKENDNQLKTKNDEGILLLFCLYYYHYIVRYIHKPP